MGGSRPAVAGRVVAVAFVVAVASCSRPEPNYYPLTEGLIWEYDIRTEMRPPKRSTVHGSFRLRVTNLAPLYIGVWQATPQRMEAGPRTSLRFFAQAHDGVAMVAEQEQGKLEPKPSDPPDLMLPYPIKLGQQWSSNAKTE